MLVCVVGLRCAGLGWAELGWGWVVLVLAGLGWGWAWGLGWAGLLDWARAGVGLGCAELGWARDRLAGLG